MGVTYKLRDEVVRFIVSQRQENSLRSCRQLAESVSQKFGLRLSKSSVHEVLRESGILMSRGRKPKFEIPQEKKKQIQANLSKVKLTALPPLQVTLVAPIVPKRQNILEYEGAGRIFLKAALWDLGIFSEKNVKGADWIYYLTYTKGIKVVLEDNREFFIDLPLPVERSIRETADGLVNNIRPLIVHKVSDEDMFKACMAAQAGFKIRNISIVDVNNHEMLNFSNIVESKRIFILRNRVFVESNRKDMLDRTKSLFFTEVVDNISVIDSVLNLKGFDSINDEELITTLLIQNGYANKAVLQAAVARLNGMHLCDEKNRSVKVKIGRIK